MENDKYMKMLFVIDEQFERAPILIEWSNGLKIKCKSTSGIFENDAEPEEDDYVGEYSIGVSEIKILEKGNDDSIELSDSSMEISILNIPEKISLEDGSVLWQRGE